MPAANSFCIRRTGFPWVPCYTYCIITLSHETEVLAQRLANARCLSADEAIRQALEGLAITPEMAGPRDQSRVAVAARRRRTDQFIAEIAAMPVLDRRSSHEIMEDLNAL